GNRELLVRRRGAVHARGLARPRPRERGRRREHGPGSRRPVRRRARDAPPRPVSRRAARAAASRVRRDRTCAVTDARLVRGVEAQLRSWRRLLAGGATRIGWKIGLNDPGVQRRLGLEGNVVGYLTDASLIAPGGRHSLAGGRMVCVEPEVAVHVGRDVPGDANRETARAAIAALGVAIEVIDVDRPFDDLEAIVAANIFHRAVMLGPPVPGASLANATGRALHDGRALGAIDLDAVADTLPELVRFVAHWLARAGQLLRVGDR